MRPRRVTDWVKDDDVVGPSCRQAFGIRDAWKGEHSSAIVLSLVDPTRRWEGSRTSVGCIAEMAGRRPLDTVAHSTIADLAPRLVGR